jgi:K+ transporter
MASSEVGAPGLEPSGAQGDGHGQGHGKAGFFMLALGSVGVVFGDIGTSPFYAMREPYCMPKVVAVTRSPLSGLCRLFYGRCSLS